MKRPSEECTKILLTCNLYLCFLTLGMCTAIPGPCLLDLRNLVNTDTQHIAFIYTARSVGSLFGCIFGGIILDATSHKLALMTFLNFLASATMIAIPWSSSLGILVGYMVINSVSLGIVDIGGNVICLTLWKSNSGPFYQALHFTFGLGSLVAPLIAAPFLGDFNSDALTEDMNNTTSFTNLTSTFNVTSTFKNSTNITSNQSLHGVIYPFSIIGVFGMIVTVMFIFICIISSKEEESQRAENKQNLQCKFGFIFMIVVLVFSLMFVEMGIEISYAQMLTTYVVKGHLKLSTATGSYMTSTFWGAFTVSRLVSIFLAIKISNFTMIVADLVITSIGAAILLLLASYEWAIWMASLFSGMGIASFCPAAIGWLDTYIIVTNKLISVFFIGAAFGNMVLPFTISYHIETVPDVFIYVVLASCILSCLIVLILYLILRQREKRSIPKPEPTCFSIQERDVK